MKINLFKMTAAFVTMSFSVFSQAPSLGVAAEYVLFTSNGAMGNTGITHLTGNVGSNSGSSTGFGNVNGVMNNNNGATGSAATDLLTAYNLLNGSVATNFPAPLMGNGQSLNAGIYSISGNTTLDQTLTLNGQNNANAVFIFKIQGTFSSNANSKVILTNGAKACNVFWKVEGLVSLASGTSMKGNVIANNAAIDMNSGVTLEGRALSTTGAISVNNILAYTPTGCGSPVLTGPASPTLGTTKCYALFSGNGPVSNSGSTFANGDVGTNVGLTTGFNALNISGTLHPIPDGSTNACAADLLVVYNYLNNLPHDIELLYPAQFGNNLVLTPHVYEINGGTTFTDTLYLNAENTASAVFVIQVNGALSTSTFAKVILINGAQAENVYWKIDGALNIDDYSEFVGTIVCNNGAVDLGTGTKLNGRAHTTDGALAVTAVTITMPQTCATTTTAIAPSILTQPSSYTVCIDSNVMFKVVATGTGLSYQWRKGGSNLSNGAGISGATTATLNITGVKSTDAAADYNVIVSGSAAPSATSANASLVAENCGPVGISVVKIAEQRVSFYPNPFVNRITVTAEGTSELNKSTLLIYNVLGVSVVEKDLLKGTTAFETNLAPGVYFYTVTAANGEVKTGRLICH